MSAWTILEGDAAELLVTVPTASIDVIVTDPPYGIGIVGQSWDGPDIQGAVARAGGEHWTSGWGEEQEPVPLEPDR